MSHLTTPLPPCISAGSEGTPSFMVDIARTPTGYEQRIGRRGYSLRKFNVGYQLRRMEQLYDVIQHFEVCEGPLHTFPFKDRLDHKSCSPFNSPAGTDVLIGTGDGAQAAFQLRKAYVRGSNTVYRTILLPVLGTVLITVAATPKTENTHYTVDYLTGVVTFTGGNIPTAGQQVKAGFEFNCKVRFDSNDLSQTYEGFRVSGMANVQLIEVIGDAESDSSGST